MDIILVLYININKNDIYELLDVRIHKLIIMEFSYYTDEEDLELLIFFRTTNQNIRFVLWPVNGRHKMKK